MLMRSDVFLLIVGTMIATLGSGAIVTYAFWRKSHQRVLLWFGLFAAPYGAILILRSSAFQLGFGAPTTFGRIAERLVAFWTIVPALLLFKEFYGEGWRSSVRWLIGSYTAFAVAAFALIVIRDRPEWIPSPATGLVFFVPVVLILGRFAGYRSPPIPNQRVLFGGLLFFFLVFSCDHLLNARGGVWRPGLEPLLGLARLRIVHCVVDVDVAFQRSLRRSEENPLRRAHADPGPSSAAEHARFHRAFDRVSVAAPWIEVDTTDGYVPGLGEIVAFAARS